MRKLILKCVFPVFHATHFGNLSVFNDDTDDMETLALARKGSVSYEAGKLALC